MNYKEKLRLAEDLYNKVRFLSSTEARETALTLEQIFPELAESEDERIRKWIRRELESRYVVDNIVNNIDADKAFAWLEKQKEQKPVGWSDEDEKMLGKCIDAASGYYDPNEKETMVQWLRSLKPQHHWKPSEENIKDLEWCADLVKEKMGVGFHRLQVFIDELKKL